MNSIWLFKKNRLAIDHKFLDIFPKNLHDDSKENELIDVGYFGLHVVHVTIKTGHKAGRWDVSCGRGLYIACLRIVRHEELAIRQ